MDKNDGLNITNFKNLYHYNQFLKDNVNDSMIKDKDKD